MKNLTRVLALVLVFSLMLSTVAFAAFTDVEVNDDYAEAIETLAALGIIKGYEDGTFGADKAITRAEAVAIVNRIQNYTAASTAGASLYTDVAADHWALGDINLATQMGTVSGDGNGLFRPEDQVSYQEMVKMLIVALGYTPKANDCGGWPTGYLVAAADAGVLDDTTNTGAAPATRGVVAQLVFNALTAPMMKQTGYGDDKSYDVMDEAGKTETLLTKKLDIYKVAVTPVASDTEALQGSVQKAGYVKVELAENDPWYGVKAPSGVGVTWLKGDSEIADQLGYAAIAYITKNADKEWEVLYSTIDTDANIAVEIDPATIDAVNTTKKVIEVEDDDLGLDEDYEYDNNTKLVVNGTAAGDFAATGMSAFEYSAGKTIDGSVTLLFNKNEDAAKYVFVKSYKTDVVDEINNAGTKVYLKSHDRTIVIDPADNKNLVYSITLDGKAIEVSDLKEYDVISYRQGNQQSDGTYNFVEIIVSRNTVEGSVDGIGTKNGKTVYTIAGEKYNASNSASASLTGKLPTKPGQSGTYYIDAFGKIAYYEKGSVANVAADYAYVEDYGVDSSTFGAELQVKLLTAEGELKTYAVADTFYVYEVKEVNGELDTVDTSDDPYDVYNPETGDANNDKVLDVVYNYVKNAKGDVIEYVVDSNGELSEITIFDTTDANTLDNDDELLAWNGGSNNKKYDELNAEIDNYLVTEDTIVFCVGSSDEKEHTVTDISILEDEESYTFDAWVVNMDLELGIMVLKTDITNSNKANIAVFIDSETKTNSEGKTVTVFNFFEGGEEKSVFGASKSVQGAAVLEIGAAFTYKTNNNGEIIKIEDAYVPEAYDVYDVADANAFMDGKDIARPDSTNEDKIVIGQVYGREGSVLKLGTLTSKAFVNHKIADSANVYVVDNTKRDVTVSVGEIGDIAKNEFDNETDKLLGYGSDKANTYYVLVKYVDKVATDVVVYVNYLNK